MRILTLLFVALVCFGCKKKEAPKAPESAQLVFPNKNSECTTGTELSATTTEVEFRWLSAPNTDTYDLRVTNIGANTTETISTSSLSAKLPLIKGSLYSWQVGTKNAAVLQSASSETWMFYNAGSETTFAPFPAEIISPQMGQSVAMDINNEITLEWIGSDLDNDISSYEIYFSTSSPPETLEGTFAISNLNTKVSVTANTVYYWKVKTIDNEGNSSDSGIFEFRAL